MYAYITGLVTDITEDTAVIEAGGIGYEMRISAQSASGLRTGENATLYVYLSATENGISLYGFASKEEKKLFLQLTGISGIGPKGAVTILGGMSADALRSNIAAGNAAALSSVKGVGKKTAERIIMELKDKVDAAPGIAVAHIKALPEGAAREAADALVALGYKPDAAENAVAAVYENGMTTSRIIHKALGYMTGR